MNLPMSNILHKTENGFTLKHDCCESIRLTFGNFSLRILNEHLEAMIDCVDNFDLNMEDGTFKQVKKPFILQMNDGLSLGFNAEEARELKELLNWTLASLSVKELLDNTDKT